MMRETMLTAHPGFYGLPENSIEYLECALVSKADAVKVDLRRTRSGDIILSRDAREDGLPRSRAFRILAAHPRKRMNCDLKSPGLELPVYEQALRSNVQRQLIFSGNVSETLMRCYRSLPQTIAWFYNAELLFPDLYKNPQTFTAVEAPMLARVIAEKLSATGAVCLNIHGSVSAAPLYESLLEANVPLSLWTPDDEAAIGKLLKDKIHNITTRNITLACWLKRNLSRNELAVV